MNNTKNKGFTLVELIIVIAILAIIMLIAIPNFSGIQQRMQVRADKATAAQIGKAIRVWFTDYTTDKTMIADDITETMYLPTATKVTVGASEKNIPGVTPVTIDATSGDYSVTPVPYESLYNVDEYISLGQKPTSLREESKTTTDTTQFYGVFLTADATSTAAKIAVAVVGKDASNNIKGLTGSEVTASYDGSKGGVAYVEP